ncbi:hypothetical protein [Streptomyces sp. NPDC021969]
MKALSEPAQGPAPVTLRPAVVGLLVLAGLVVPVVRSDAYAQ